MVEKWSKGIIKCLTCEYGSSKEKFGDRYLENLLDLKGKNLEDRKQLILKEVEQIFDFFTADINIIFKKDPAAKNILEILTVYPGIHAILIYRVAHFLWEIGLPFLPRYLSFIIQRETGIDIHPGAKIGRNFFIDHGQGVVIGETAKIGDNVTIYQGVTIGGVKLEAGKRHPTIGNNVIIGAGSKVLGAITIGDNVKIGANSVVTKDVPSDKVVVGIPAKSVSNKKEYSKINKKMNHLTNPSIEILKKLEQRISQLEEQMRKK